MGEIVDTLLGAKDKLLFGGWHTGSRAKDAEGNCCTDVDDPDHPEISRVFMNGWDPRAVSWCLVGAVEAVEGKRTGPAFFFVEGALSRRGYASYMEFNDKWNRTKNQVIGMLDDIICDAKEAGV